jgi:hypothetical protein
MLKAMDLPKDFVRVQVGTTKASIIQLGKGAKPKTVNHGDGFSTHTAEFVLADGTKLTGTVDICMQDSGEHWGSMFYCPWNNQLANQNEDTKEVFLGKLRKSAEEVYPYKYRYHDWKKYAGSEDFHIDEETGWS